VRVLPEGPRGPPPRELLAHLTAWGPVEARAFDLRSLSAAVRGALALLLPPAMCERPPAGPVELSYWAAANLPLEPGLRQALLAADHAAARLRMLASLLARADRVACAG
jgi:Lon protease-like protein